ncbi:MAG: glycosyltransferase family 4 protein [Sphingomonadaceae bacterium]
MRLLLWGNYFPLIGGVETFLRHLAGALTARGIEVGILSDGKELRSWRDEAWPVWNVPMTAAMHRNDPEKILTAAKAVRRVIGDFLPDLLHYHSNQDVLFFDLALRRDPRPAVATLHHARLTGGERGSLQMLLRSCLAVTAVSNQVAREIAEIDSSARTIVIPNAIPPRPDPVPYPANKRIFGLGRLIPDKGFDILLAAFAIVLRSHSGARLVIAGEGPDREILQAEAKTLGIESAIEFPGWIRPGDVHAAISASAMLVVPSRWQEPFGLVALEAAEAARPCIATRVGELPAIIVEGETGLVVPSEDPEAMAAAVARLLDHPEEAAAMGKKARARSRQEYGFERMIDRYVDVYERYSGAPRLRQLG